MSYKCKACGNPSDPLYTYDLCGDCRDAGLVWAAQQAYQLKSAVPADDVKRLIAERDGNAFTKRQQDMMYRGLNRTTVAEPKRNAAGLTMLEAAGKAAEGIVDGGVRKAIAEAFVVEWDKTGAVPEMNVVEEIRSRCLGNYILETAKRFEIEFDNFVEKPGSACQPGSGVDEVTGKLPPSKFQEIAERLPECKQNPILPEFKRTPVTWVPPSDSGCNWRQVVANAELPNPQQTCESSNQAPAAEPAKKINFREWL